MITCTQIHHWIVEFEQSLTISADDLNRLDAALGDGDFGASMKRGLSASVSVLSDLDTDSIGAILRTTGSTIVSAIGGTSGPLVGTLFLKAGMDIGDVSTCDVAALSRALRTGANGVMDLGGAALGDKTMLDSLFPAIDALEQSALNGDDIVASAKRSAAAAATAADKTSELRARRGRASYTGSGGEGHIDPGAQGMAILFAALVLAVEST